MTGPRPLAAPSPDEWRRLEPLLDAVLDASRHRRPALIAQLSGGDATRQAELERLVAECEHGYPLLERPAAERFGALFGDEAPPVPELLAGRYRLIREAGRGGMAIVYLARDLKHGRDVAVKVVRPELAPTFGGRSRFLREIEIAARLRHPNIVPLYDSGEIAATGPDGERSAAERSALYYVMPYEAGHSLRERLARDGPLPIEDVVRILHDICEALAHAHQAGIVHLDIKPDNVLLAGRHAMVTDFGVARAVSGATAEANPSLVGIAIGTPVYMSPEQAAGATQVDHRADIYAVGVLANELLAGRTAPDALATMITKCLARRPADRWQSVAELLDQLGPASVASGAPAAEQRGPAGHPRMQMPVAVAAVAVLALAALAAVMARPRATRAPLLLGDARQLTFEPGLEVQPSLSPDGRYVAYAVGQSLRMRIAVRPVAGGKALRLTSDSAGSQWLPRWSADGARILFLSGGGVFSAPASGGHAREEVRSRPGAIVTSATWSPDDREIAYVRGDSLLARTVGADRARLITTGADLHSCAWSPDGTQLACVSGNSFYVTVGALLGFGPMFGNLAPSQIVMVPAAGGRPMSVTDGSSLHQSPAWSGDGKTLYFVSDGQGPRDIYTLDVSAHPSPRSEPVRVTTGMGAQSVSLSSDGTRVVYAAYTSTANVWAMPIPRGRPGSLASAVPVTTGNQTVEGVRVTPDGQWLVYDSNLSGKSQVYRMPVTGGDAEQLTHGPYDAFRGVLSPDGRELVYHSFRAGARNLFLLPLGGGPERQLTPSSSQHSMANWSPDGNALTFFDIDAAQVFVMRRNRQGRWGRARLIGVHGVRPEWSPDGRTIAFVSPSDGRISIAPADSGTQRDVYVPHGGDPWAELAIFAPDGEGRVLYFKSHDASGRASFWLIAAPGGRPRLLARLDDPARASNRFEFATDGKRLYFTLEDRQSDIWVAAASRR